jgi:hypothetical protein
MTKIVKATPASVTRTARAVLRAAGLLDAVVKVSSAEGPVGDNGRQMWVTDVDMVRSEKSVKAAVDALSAAYPGATVKATPYANIMIVRVTRPQDEDTTAAAAVVIDGPAEGYQAGGEFGPGRDERFADGRPWAQQIDVARSAGITDTAEAERAARVYLAEDRRNEHPELRTWAPGDELPKTPPHGVFDVDGYVWELQAHGIGVYRLAEAGRELLAAEVEPGDELLFDTVGERLWPYLLDGEGPVTETVPVRGVAAAQVPTLPRQWLAPSGRPIGHPTGIYNGHEFEYDRENDLHLCVLCERYEVTVKVEADEVTGEYPRCTGFPAYGGDLARVYLRLTINPDVAGDATRMIADALWQFTPVIGRTPRFGWNPDTCKLLVETTPGRVDELHEKLIDYRRTHIHTGDGGFEIPVVRIDQLTGDEGLELLADNYARYVAEHGTRAGA